ncbi:MAG TPA: histone deacetylase [Methanomicrobiales archaeon]|nr:histone deacetylase [Methanomicrobiales archaeon]
MTCGVVTGKIFCRHQLPGHPESPDRLRLAIGGVPRAARRLDPAEASREDLERVHRREYLAWLRGVATGECYIDFNTYICPDSFEVARFAAGSAARAAEEALDGHSCFALVRPPGHHAGPGRASGYCLLNNVAVAAARALGSVDRVAIVDWDLHHGNGTQEIFYDDDRVLFCSVHQGEGFPGSGVPGETGAGQGHGYTLNAPLESGCGIADYELVFGEVFCPALERFRPDLLLVSAGQDALADDPKGVMRLAPGDYGILTRMLREATDLPLALTLEGGYGPSLGKAIAAIFRGLGGGRPAQETGPPPARSTREMVRILKKVQASR